MGSKQVLNGIKDVTSANYVADVTLPSPWPTDPAIGTSP